MNTDQRLEICIKRLKLCGLSSAERNCIDKSLRDNRKYKVNQCGFFTSFSCEGQEKNVVR